MPAPIAKGSGIVITVSALVAAGIAAYQSPQFQEWVNNSRRKIALTLHNLGDGIQPRDSTTPLREDMSMAEETSEAAQERRRLAREEILQRGVVFEARRRKKQSSPPNSFDTLVDDRGKLRDDDLLDTSSNSLAKSTAIDLSASQPVPSEKQNDGSIPDAADRNRLHLELPSDSPKTHSETLVDLTPTSEAATPLSMPANGTSEEIRPAGFFHDVGHEDLGARSAPSSCSADSDDSLGFYSPHPDPNNESQQNFASPFADFQSSSPTSATGGSFSHIYEVEGGSDGTASDFGRSSDGAATPASWSEIGSVISSEEVYHQGM